MLRSRRLPGLNINSNRDISQKGIMSGRSKAKQHELAARIFGVLGLIGVVVIPIMVVACGNSTNAEVREMAVDNITEVKIASDSVWRVPAGLSIVLPMTNERLHRMLVSEPTGPPDIPEFTIQGAIVEGQDEGQIIIAAIYSDGITDEADASAILTSWRNSFKGAEFGEIVSHGQGDVQWATTTGTVRSSVQSVPQAASATVFSQPETRRVWRLVCIMPSDAKSDEAIRICDQIREGFRPTHLLP